MGPNNAGKSTAISALRLCATLLNQAKRRKADKPIHDTSRDRRVRGDYVSLPAGQFIDENVRHEFRPVEARLELWFKNGAALYVVWPPEDPPYFYLEHICGNAAQVGSQAKQYYPSFGIIPTLSPIEHQEVTLSSQHVRDNLTTKLVSRHFRNQLWQVATESSAIR